MSNTSPCFTRFFVFFKLQSIMSWATRDPAYNSDSKLFFFSFVAFASGQITSYPLAVIRTQQQAQGKPQSYRVILGRFVITCFVNDLSHVFLFLAFSTVSLPASGVLQGLMGIYERHGLKGYYNGMGASFIRAIPCALINFTLTKKFENMFSSIDS